VKHRELKKELIAFLDDKSTPPITRKNIGKIRRRLFMPWNSEWNAIVREETAARESH
jgi:hypothetical protein